MSSRVLYTVDGLLWLTNSGLWAFYAHSPALATFTFLAACGCAFLAWRIQ